MQVCTALLSPVQACYMHLAAAGCNGGKSLREVSSRGEAATLPP